MNGDSINSSSMHGSSNRSSITRFDSTASPFSSSHLGPSPPLLSDDLDPAWLAFFPRCNGAVHIDSGDALHPLPFLSSPSADFTSPFPSSFPSPSAASVHLHLSDLTSSYRRPCLLDVKLGVVSSDPFCCSAEKARREAAKCPAQAQAGWRICGARVWTKEEKEEQKDEEKTKKQTKRRVLPWGSGATAAAVDPASSGAYAVYDKQWCRSIRLDQLAQPFWTFLAHQSDSRGALVHPRMFTPSAAAIRRAPVLLPRSSASAAVAVRVQASMAAVRVESAAEL